MMIINIIIPGKTEEWGFGPKLKITDGVLSVWGFVLSGFVSVGFCQGGVLSCAFLSCGVCPVGFNPVGFCPVGFSPVKFCQGGVLSCGVLSGWGFVNVGFCPGFACYWLKKKFMTVCRHFFKFSRYYGIIIIIHCKKGSLTLSLRRYLNNAQSCYRPTEHPKI